MQTLNLPIQIIVNRQVSANPWLDYSYQVIAVMPTSTGQDSADFIAVKEDDFLQKHFHACTLQLFEDACVSYYQNLMADSPRLYVIGKSSGDEFGFSPILVTVDYNEAHAYLETETQVYTTDIHPLLYQQIEDFVVRFYHYEKPYKRKRKSEWKENTDNNQKIANNTQQATEQSTEQSDLPDLATLDANDKNANFQAFLGAGVSEALKKQALRKLFSASVFNVRDGLDDYDDDFTQFSELGDTVTADMRHRLERLQALAENDTATETDSKDSEDSEDSTDDTNISTVATAETENVPSDSSPTDSEQAALEPSLAEPTDDQENTSKTS